MELVLGGVCTTCDLLWIFPGSLVRFLVAKLSDTNLLSIKNGETATRYILKLYRAPFFLVSFGTSDR